MGTEKDSTTSNDTDRDITADNDVSGKLRLNKQTLQDLNPADQHADKVRGGALPGSAVCGHGRCSEKESGCN